MIIDDKTITCCHEGCGIPFSVPAHWYTKRREDHTRFFCPNGHGQSFSSESGEEKMRRERDIAKQQLARAEDEKNAAIRQRDEAKMAAARAAKRTKQLTERAVAGVCPCCTRTVSQLARHMKTKHPEFVAEETTNVVSIKKVAK